MSFAGDLRAVVRHRDFRRLFATRLTSQAADGAFQAALASLFFFSPERQTSAGSVAAAFATLLLPYSLVGPFAGVLLDRWRRRQVLVVANLLRAGMVLGVAALSATGVTGIPLYAAVLACLSVNRFFLAGLSAALPHVVSRDELVMANSVSTTTGTVVAITGGGIGFALKRLLGEGNVADAQVIVVAAAAYAVAAGIAARMDRDLLGPDLEGEPPQTRAAVRKVALGLVDGARHIWSHRPAGHALAAIGAHRFFYGVSTISAILLFRNHFHEPADVDGGLSGLAAAFAASGAGFFVAAIVTPEVTHRISKQSWITICFGLAAAAEAVFVVRAGRVAALRRGVRARRRCPGLQDLRRHDRADLGRRRLPRPGLLVLRRHLQHRVRLGCRVRCRRPAGRRLLTRGVRGHRRWLRADRPGLRPRHPAAHCAHRPHRRRVAGVSRPWGCRAGRPTSGAARPRRPRGRAGRVPSAAP